MDKAVVRKVTLPGGKVVRVSDSPQDWWTEDGASGYVHPKLLAPDPDQPRGHMNEVELKELTDSVSEIGVREPIPVTPLSMAPWAKVKPEHVGLPFLIVTGHRRTESATRAELAAVPIRVVVYDSEADYLLDASVLNKNRADLTPIEEGREIVRLKNKGVTLDRIRKSLGKSMTHVYNRINLTRLHPRIQELLNPALPPSERLQIVIGGDLGEMEAPTLSELEELIVVFDKEIRKVSRPGLVPKTDVSDLSDEERRFELQKIFLAVVEIRNLTVEQARELIKEHKLQQAVARGTHTDSQSSRLEPRKRKQILINLAGDVTGSTVIGWTPGEHERIFASSSAKEVEVFQAKLQFAGQNLLDIARILERIAKTKRVEEPARRRS